MSESPILEIINLNKNFNQENILSNISFEIRKGETIVVVGPSGGGKSTLLRCINGLEEISSGEIKLNGHLIDPHKDKNMIRQKIAMVFQSYDLFPHMNVLDNILLGPTVVQKRNKQEARQQAKSLLERVKLIDKVNAYPRQLSGGQKQRVAICRALCMNPEIILFDEVTASLDPEMVKEVLDVIRELALQGTTMIVVTHELAFAKAVANRFIFIDKGVILNSGTKEELAQLREGIATSDAEERINRFMNSTLY